MRKGRYPCYKVWCHLSNFSNTTTIIKTNTNTKEEKSSFFVQKICNWRIKMDVFLINEKIESLSQNLKEIKESL